MGSEILAIAALHGQWRAPKLPEARAGAQEILMPRGIAS